MHKEIPLSATCVRVPTLRGHAEALTLTFKNDGNLKMFTENTGYCSPYLLFNSRRSSRNSVIEKIPSALIVIIMLADFKLP